MKAIIKQAWSLEFVRFLIVGGCNIVFGYLLAIMLFKIFVALGIKNNLYIYDLFVDVPLLLSALLGIPIAYTAQTLFTFREKWDFRKLILYPITVIPNIFVQQVTYYLASYLLDALGPRLIKVYIAYGLAAITPIPVMFILVKLVIKGKKREFT